PSAMWSPSALTPRQQAGQRVIYAYSGLTPPAALLDTIRNGEAAGVIFFGRNVSSNSQLKQVAQQLNAAAQESPVTAPLLLMTDQEGGQIRRLSGAPEQSEKQIGASADPPGEASAAGTGAGQNLLSAGLNLNLAPVLDVYRHAGDFADQYGRSYSTTPGICGSAGSHFVTAQQATGVAATAKHFPGLGAAAADENTDAEPVTLNNSLSDIRNIDEAPYSAAIAAGIKLVMTSWAVYPALDPDRPAGLSSTIVQGELRDRLGFTGVTITDAIGAGALNAFGATGQRAVLAAEAGMDLILASASTGQGDDAVDGLTDALQSGQLDQAAFTAAVQRVTALRESL
ncbi:MAG: glycoside hydrolase family 3 N-terminal domain-containing protein, partial [Actinocatenispora sp.]